MVTPINIDIKWGKDILDLAEKFNNYAQKGSLRMVSFLIDKAFDILSDDKNPNQLDAAYFLVQIRSLNPSLISPYISTLIDAKIGQKLIENEEYIIPDYTRYPVSDKYGQGIIFSDPYSEPEEEADDIEIIDSEKKETEITLESKNDSEEGSTEGGLLDWDLKALLAFKVIKNIEKIKYDEIKSPIKKCAAGDGYFEKGDKNIWRCKECGTSYHENCVKIIAILEGQCRICDAPFMEKTMINADQSDLEDVFEKETEDDS